MERLIRGLKRAPQRKAAAEAEARGARARRGGKKRRPRCQRKAAAGPRRAVLGIFIAGAMIVTAVVFLVPNGPPITPEKADKDAARRDALSVQPGSGQSFRDRLANGQPCPTCPEMVVVPNGKFTMGSPDSEPGRDDDEVQVSVSIAKSFAVGKFAVTRIEFAAFVEETGHKTDGGCYTWSGSERKLQANNPVVCVNWNDANAYAEWLSSKTGKTYRLLSEAEREYVTRAGTTTPFWWGTSITPQFANYNGDFLYAGGGSKGEYRQRTVPVDSFEPNPWGLYNVHGNAWEWTEDCWNASNSGNPGNGSARTTGDCRLRVLRGGSWVDLPQNLRSASRTRYSTVNRINTFRFPAREDAYTLNLYLFTTWVQDEALVEFFEGMAALAICAPPVWKEAHSNPLRKAIDKHPICCGACFRNWHSSPIRRTGMGVRSWGQTRRNRHGPDRPRANSKDFNREKC